MVIYFHKYSFEGAFCMDYNNEYNNAGPDYNGYNSYPARRKTSGFEIASLILGIASIVTCCFGIFSIPLGVLSILFAILSRGKDKKMSGMSIAGICTSVAGIILGGLLCICAAEAVYNTDFREKYIDPAYEQTYGMTMEEFMQRYGYSIE
jgi:hypothetical protein